ncbi:PRC-barrel domain-containing protein [Sphingomonas immobilis]|uniref:PRC-barrel domain-containing protein n=1 Tax=Sphingomonas immobilis TaxID=3063997 RepID=A0ABT9A2G7_9SPHN|nr:PRC-barrel domain-containing protein [Sphingomonas sp. CA1-15]MDO7844029.1 PRC-barrel domain-containing protein [Sphingomonas sp. CA1-15]
MTDPATQRLIDSNRADAMKVKSRDGDSVGSVHAFMIDKRSGRTLYAVLAIGGFLGIGKAFYPLPFGLLSFDATSDTYVVTIDRRVLEGGPSWANTAPVFDQAYADRVAKYYDVAVEDLSVI